MVLILEKGGKVNIQKENPGMTIGEVGLGWDQLKSVKAADLDAFLLEIGDNGKVANGDLSLIYYGRKSNANKSVYVGEDNLTGEGEGYDEHGYMDFAKVPTNVKEVIVGVSIYDYAARGQNFGQVENAKVDVLDSVAKTVLGTYDLSEDMSNFTGLIVGKFRRESDGNFSFKPVGEGFKGGMKEILTKYGL